MWRNVSCLLEAGLNFDKLDTIVITIGYFPEYIMYYFAMLTKFIKKKLL